MGQQRTTDRSIVKRRWSSIGPAPASKIPEPKVQVAGVAAMTFESEAAVLRHSNVLAGSEPDAERAAICRVHDYKLV